MSTDRRLRPDTAFVRLSVCVRVRSRVLVAEDFGDADLHFFNIEAVVIIRIESGRVVISPSYDDGSGRQSSDHGHPPCMASNVSRLSRPNVPDVAKCALTRGVEEDRVRTVRRASGRRITPDVAFQRS